MTFVKGQSGNPHGRWRPGQSGNPRGRPPSKPFKEALARLREKNPAVDDEIAEALTAKALTGDVAAIKEIADRLDGKVPQAIGGAAELGAVTVRWLGGDEDEAALPWLDEGDPPAITDETKDQ